MEGVCNISNAHVANFLLHTDNFHLVSTGSGAANYIQLLTDISVKMSLPNVINTGTDCIVNADTNSTENQWYIEDLAGNINTGVRLYLLSEAGERWYLRAPLIGGTVDLVCEDYVTSIANVSKHINLRTFRNCIVSFYS